MISSHIYKTEAIVLGRKNTGEADRILTLFTKTYGKIRVLAKGIRKVRSRRASHAEVFCRSVFLLHTGKTQLDLVTEVSPVSSYQKLRKNLTAVGTAYFMCELVGKLLPERQENGEIYEYLVRQLSLLDAGDGDAVPDLTESFARRLLRMLGYLDEDGKPDSRELEAYIEEITERRIQSLRFIRRLEEAASSS
ncbi:DNA repair protein RecO [Patescibacteria group bacterium]|nr:DNA repair protein RecO [Patescibacteria group bacterium]